MKDANPKTIYLQDYEPPNYWITHTDIEFDLFEEETLVTSRLGLQKNSEVTTGNSLTLNGVDLELVSVAVNNRELSASEYECDEESLTLFDLDERVSLVVVTKIDPKNNTSLEGLYKSQKMFCTQCEAEGFRKITYYLDRPDVMSEFTTKITADKHEFPLLLSNGNKIGQGDLDNGRHWVKWLDPFKKPCYLFALVAGDLVCIDDSYTTMSGRKVDLQIFVEEKDLDKCDHAMQSLKNAMQWDEQIYGREYDLDIFMIVAVDDFNMGAMENKGLNIF